MMNRSSSAEAFFVPSMMSFVALESSGQKHHAWDWETCSSPNLNTSSTSNNLQGQALYPSAPFLDCQPPPLLPMNGLPFYPAPPPVPAEYPVGLIKREVDGVLGCGRIGLNLGHRTYFSSGEALNIDRLFARSRGVYSLSHQPPRCQAEGCRADLSGAKHYHRRHKVCEFHSKATVVVVGELQQRFCQQCSRFHVLAEFDEAKRSCRKRLADHNRRRRKPQHPAAATAVSETSALRNTTTNSSEKTKQAQRNPGDNITSKSTGSTNCSTSTKVNLEGTQQCQIKGNLLRNGPALSLGGLAMEKGGMGPHDMYQAQGPFATVLAREKVSQQQQQQHSFHLHHNLFCSTSSHEASQSTGGGPGQCGASDHHLESRLHLGQAMFEVDYM